MDSTIAAIIASVCTVISTIVVAWFSYNQKTKDKLTDYKISKLKEESEKIIDKKSEEYACILQELYRLLYEFKASRVYILQPHPLIANEYLSISLEITKKGVSSMKPTFTDFPMNNLAYFSKELATRDFILYKNITADLTDKRMNNILSSNGTKSVAIKLLKDQSFDWKGNIFIEYTYSVDIDAQTIINLKRELSYAAESIQYILPEYKSLKDVN